MLRINHLHLFFTLFFLLILSACGGETEVVSSDTSLEDTSLSIAPQLDISRRIAATINTTGGTIETTSNGGTTYSLSLPEGALAKGIEIALTPVMEIPNLAFVDRLLGGVQFEPDGLLLTKPATLTIDLPTDTDFSNVLGLGWSGTGENTHLELVTLTDTQATLLISHFSGSAVVEGNAASAAAATSSATTLEAKYKTLLVAEDALIYQRICGNSHPAICFGADEDFNTVRYDNALYEVGLELTALWLNEIVLLASDASTNETRLKFVTEEFFTWEHNTQKLFCGDGSECARYPGAYAEIRQHIRTDIAKGVIAAFDRALETNDDFKVLNLIGQVELLGGNDPALTSQGIGFYIAFLDLLEQPLETSLDHEFRQRYGRQLVINVQDFPLTLVQGGDSADFSIRLSLLSTGEPLSNLDIEIGPNFTGCASLDGRGDLSVYTTDSNGTVEGLTVAAENSCSEPIDRSLIFIKVTDDAIGLVTGTNFYLGREIAFEAIHDTKKLQLTDGIWHLQADVSHNCNIRDALCYSGLQEAIRLNGELPPSVNRSASVSKSTTNGSVSADATISYAVDVNPANGDLLEIHLDASISAAASANAPDLYYSDSDADISSSGIVNFKVLDSAVNYSATWLKSGFTDDLATGYRSTAASLIRQPTFTTIFTTATAGNEDSFNLTGTLEPGSYRLSFGCEGGAELTTRNGGSSYSDSGTCALDFTVK